MPTGDVSPRQSNATGRTTVGTTQMSGSVVSIGNVCPSLGNAPSLLPWGRSRILQLGGFMLPTWGGGGLDYL